MSRKSDDSSRLRVSSSKDGSNIFCHDKTDMVSYEDLLIAQYLDELRRTKSEIRRNKDVPPSPYSQKLPHSDYGYYTTKKRPFSATAPCRPQSGGKPKIDAKFIADPNLWDPATPRSSSRKSRPVSAPVHRKGRHRPASGISTAYWFQNKIAQRPISAFSGRRIKSQYRKQPSLIRVTALKNGSMDNFIRVAAPTMKVFLEMCTDKLSLPFAARRVFLEDGKEIFDAHDIPVDGQVFVSTGENFKDPYKNVKRNMIISQGAKWTLSGVLIPEDGHIKTSAVKMSKRMKALTEKRRVRIIVYRNGMSTEPSEVVADLNKQEEFMVACTSKLNLRSHAKIVFDWEGNEITHLTQTPVLDDCLQPGGTAILGPVWISTGESFSATATLHYINSIRQVLNDRLKDAQRYKKEINFAMEGQNEKISITAILSMSEEELYDTFDLAEKEIKQLKDTLADLQTKISAIEEIKLKEEAEGSNYRMNHIQELSMDHKLVGMKGLRLKVYENGCASGEQTFFFNLSGALKGSGKNNNKDHVKIQLQRLLDDLSTNRLLSNPVNPKLAPIAKKIFDKYGNEIKNILHLEYDQEIWVSFGEPFITPFTYCLQTVFDQATGYDLGEKVAVVREQLLFDDIKDIKSHREFEASAGFPSDYKLVEFKASNEDGLRHANDLNEQFGLSSTSHFMQVQVEKDRSLVLYPEIVINQKLKKGHSSVWPTEAQVLIISKRGYIYCKAMPQLCLAVSDTRVEFNISDKADVSNGFVVNLQKATRGNVYQQWNFNPDATMSPVAHPDLVMTYTGHKFGDEEGYVQPEGVSPGQKVYLVVTDRLPRKEASFQRFALKQERFENLGQWKLNEATNEEWRKLAYSWPVKEDGSLNEDYDWPMEAYIIPNAPKLHKLQDKNKLSGLTPLRLMALKNGERDIRKAIPVVGPNLTNMVKDMGKDKTNKSKNKKPSKESDGVEDDVVTHGREELELIMFLDHCTSLLDLPFAARRLYDSKGNEHFNLSRLKRDEIVYVSCGETWTDPKLTRAEQQRRFLLSQLSQDVAKIRQYCALRNPENYVLEIEGNLTANNRLIVNQQWKLGQAEDPDMIDTQSHASLKSYTSGKSQKSSKGQSSVKDDVDSMSSPDFQYSRTAHEKSHEMSEHRLNNLKWPWERLVNVDQSNGLDDPEANKYTDREMYERYKPVPLPKISRDTLQRFVFEDGYIACAANRNLVLGVLEQEGRVSQVLLVKRRPDDIHQRWIMRENGEIRSRHGQKSVITVAMPANEPFAEDEQGRPLTFKGCAVTVQQRKNNTYGKAHQRWRYDAETGFIHAFYTNRYDKEITAANKADVCTHSIADHSPIDQPGYMAEVPVAMPTDKQSVKEIMVCTSCARAMRGRYKLHKLEEKTEFSCAMGEAKKLKLQQIGSFRVLNGKVDLSTHEAELTLQSWEDTLSSLRDETSVRVIAKELSVAKTVRTVKILAYKNGEGRLHPGELICGSSIEGILGQCTHRLRLANAAQRIFTEDGNLVLDVDDLVDWAVENYKTLMADQMERIISGEGVKKSGRRPGLLKSLQEEEDEEEAEESYKTTWIVSVVTSNQASAGTDANVFLVVYGAIGKSDTITLDNRSDNFERGKTDRFKIDMINIGKPYKVRVWHDNSGFASGWKLDKIVLENEQSKDVFTFPCGRWMATDEEDGSIMRELAAQGDTIQNPLPLVRYTVEVYTGNMFRAGTNAHVFINVFGQLGDTGDRPLTDSKTNKIKFERGKIDVFHLEAVTVGRISKIVIGHDGNGMKAGWYLDKVKVTQEGTDEFDTVFECGRWLSTEEDDGATVRELFAEGEEDNLYQTNENEDGSPERGEGEGQDSLEEAPNVDAAEVDQEESEKVAREREKLLEKVTMPPLEVILRYPIEVWISSGKEFVPPEKVESKMESRMKKRAFRSSVSLELDIEKHVLRQMRARRMEDMNPGEYKSTRSSKQPVVIEGNWQEPTAEEQIKHDTVHKLETHLAEVKENQKERQQKFSFGHNTRLYKQPDMKRLMVYPNGESLERAMYIWGDSIESLLESATIKLGLWQHAKYLYNMEGTLIVKFSDVNRDELLCVSTGKPFAKPHSTQDTVEVKANWSRARKQYGPSATDFVVQASTNPKVDVDPFGPPELALPPQTETKPLKAPETQATTKKQ